MNFSEIHRRSPGEPYITQGGCRRVHGVLCSAGRSTPHAVCRVSPFCGWTPQKRKTQQTPTSTPLRGVENPPLCGVFVGIQFRLWRTCIPTKNHRQTRVLDSASGSRSGASPHNHKTAPGGAFRLGTKFVLVAPPNRSAWRCPTFDLNGLRPPLVVLCSNQTYETALARGRDYGRAVSPVWLLHHEAAYCAASSCKGE